MKHDDKILRVQVSDTLEHCSKQKYAGDINVNLNNSIVSCIISSAGQSILA